MAGAREFNALVKNKPTYVKTLDDVRNASDFLKSLAELRSKVKEEKTEAVKELMDKIEALTEKYNKVMKAIDEVEGEIRGKIKNYAEGVIKSGELLEKKVKGEKSSLTFIADKKVEVSDPQALIQSVADGKYPESFIKFNVTEIKKFAKSTQKEVDGCTITDTVYFQIR